MDCPFCKIAKNELPSWKIFENPKYMIILPLDAHAWGHLLVIPKGHYRWCSDVDDPEFWQLTNKMSKLIKKTYNAKFILGIQHGIGVSHAHNHLIPRFDNDGHGEILDDSKIFKFSDSEKDKMLKELKANLVVDKK